MDMSKYTGSPYIKPDDVRQGPLKLRIKNVSEGSFDRPMLEFVDFDGKFSLNVTNTKTLTAHYGKNSDDWIGQEIELYLGQAPYDGKTIDSVLVRPISPTIPFKDRRDLPPEPKPEPVAIDLNDEIPF
jgi:hypothetical protein